MGDSEDAVIVVGGLPDPGCFHEEVNKCLTRYFEIKRLSGGGECSVQDEAGTPVVKFKSKTVRDRVLKKNSHTVDLPGFGKTELTLKPYCKQPPVPPKDDSSSLPDKKDDGAFREERVIVCDMYGFDNETLKLYAEKITQEKVDVYPLTENKIWLDCSQEAVQKIQAVKEHVIEGKIVKIFAYTSTEMDEIIDTRRLVVTGVSENKFAQHHDPHQDEQFRKWMVRWMELAQLFIASNTSSDEEMFTVEYLDNLEKTVGTFKNPIDWKSALKCARKRKDKYKITATMLEASNCVLVEAPPGSLCEDFLTLYFENSARSGGGCLSKVHLKDNKGAAYLYFSDRAVRDRVLQKSPHAVDLTGFGNTQLTLKPHSEKPPVLPKRDSSSQPVKKDDGALREERVVVCDIDGFDDETLKLYAEKITQEKVNVYPLTQNKIWLECSQEAGRKIQVVERHAIGGKRVKIFTYTSTEMDEIIDKQRLILTGFPPTFKKEMVELYVQAIIDAEILDIEYLKNGEIAAVTFKNSIDWTSALKRCANKCIGKCKITGTMLEASNCVLVESSQGSLNADLVTLYFENPANTGGGIPSLVELIDSNAAANLYFSKPSEAQNVASRKHKLKATELKLYLYYKELDSTLGQQIPVADPEPFDVEVDSRIIQFISRDICSMDQLKDILNKANSSFTLDLNGKITFTPNLDKDAVNFQSLALKWQQIAKISFLGFHETFSNIAFPCSTAAWERVKEEVTHTDDVLVDYNSQQAQVFVTGRNQNVQNVCQQIKPIVKKVEKDLHRESQIISDHISLESPDKYNLLQMLRIEGLRAEFNTTELKFDEKSYSLTVRGMPQDCQKIKDEIAKCLKGISSKEVNISSEIVTYLKMLDRDILNEDLFSQGIYAKIQVKNNHSISIIACDNHLVTAECYIKKTFKEKSVIIPEESLHATQINEWDTLLSRLEENNVNNIPQVYINKCIDRDGFCVDISVSGFDRAVDETCQELHSFCEKRKEITEKILLNSKHTLKYLQDHEQIFKHPTLLNKKIKPISETVLEISGHPDEVIEVKNFVTKASSAIVFKSLTFNNPGAAKYMKESKRIIETISQSKQNCMVLIDVESPPQTTAIQLASPASVQTQSSAASTSPTCMTTKEGLKISLVIGSIETENSDVIINTTSANMKMDSGGVSSAIFRKAGPTLQNLVDNVTQGQPIRSGKLVKTDVMGLNLQCQAVYHTTLGSWDNGKHLQKFMKRSLDMAHQDRVSSISFPALGTGNLKYPPTIVSSMMFAEVINFSQKNQGTTLKDIKFVIFNKDQLVISDFQTELAQQLLGKTAVPPTLNSTSNGAQRTIGSISVEVVDGDITKEIVDAIVNSTNTTLDLNSGVSAAILAAAGPAVVLELANLGAQPDDGVVTTSPGSLKCKNIVHMVGQKDFAKMTNSILKVLDECSKVNCQSVSFPALGTGKGGIQPGPVADAMLDAFEKFSLQNPQSNVSSIRIMILQPVIKTAFIQALTQFQPGGKKVQPPQTSSSTANIQQNGLKLHRATVQAVSGDITKETTDVIVNSTTNAIVFMSGVSGAILKAAGQVVVDECTKLGPQPGDAVVATSGGALHCKHIVHMVGQTDPASIKSSVLKVLQECETKKATSVSFPATGTGAGSVSPGVVADAMMEGIEEHVRVHALTSTLTLIRFVIFQPQMLNDFQQAIINKSQMTVSSTGIGIQTPSLPLKKIPQIKSSYKNEKVVIQVYGKPQKDVEDVCEHLEDIINRNCMANNMKIDCVESLSNQELKELEKVEKSCDVKISIATTHISIEGLTSDVCKAVFDVTQVVQDLKIKLEKEKIEENYVPKQDVPAEWAPMQGKDFDKVALVPQSPEYKQVEANFLRSSPNLKIIKIERIQNRKLYNVYQAMKTSFQASHKGQGAYEQTLFHGTQIDSIDNINHGGFNRSYAGRNATAFGVGTYFARDSSYSSNDTYSKPDANGTKYMYQARVLTGSYCKGVARMKEPPLKNPQNTTERFDCVVNDPSRPSIFVIFYDNQACPEYLISFSR